MSLTSFINPLRFVFETDSHPHARTLRTGFFQKVKDAFRIFSGELYGSQEANLGLIDIPTFGLLWVFEEYSYIGADEAVNSLKLLYANDDPLAFKFLAMPLLAAAAFLSGGIWLSLYLLRTAISIVLTGVSLPVIGLVAMVSFFVAKKARETVLKAQATIENDTKDLVLLLQDKGKDLEDLIIKEKGLENSEDYIKFKFLGFEKISEAEKPLESQKIKLNITNPKVLEAITQLNIGNYTKKEEIKEKRQGLIKTFPHPLIL